MIPMKEKGWQRTRCSDGTTDFQRTLVWAINGVYGVAKSWTWHSNWTEQYKILTMGKKYNVNSLYYFCSNLILFQIKGLKNSNSFSSHLKYKVLNNVSIKSKQDPCLSPQLHLPYPPASLSSCHTPFCMLCSSNKFTKAGPTPQPLHLLFTMSGMFFTSSHSSSVFHFREAIVEHLSKIIFSPTLLSFNSLFCSLFLPTTYLQIKVPIYSL